MNKFRSRITTEGRTRSGARSLWRANSLKDDDFDKPIIAIDDGIAMGHNEMLYSLPSRDLIADSMEYMVQSHVADAMIFIPNCDKIIPGMLMAAMRLNIPAIFVSAGPLEAGLHEGNKYDLIDVMRLEADKSVSDEDILAIEKTACPIKFNVTGLAFNLACLFNVHGMQEEALKYVKMAIDLRYGKAWFYSETYRA